MNIISPERAAFENLARLAERAVIAMIESHADQRAGPAGGIRHRIQFAARRAPGFSMRTCLPAAAASAAMGASTSCVVAISTMSISSRRTVPANRWKHRTRAVSLQAFERAR